MHNLVGLFTARARDACTARRQFGVAHGVLNIAVAQIGL
jgi:hypothetical protein